MSGSLLDSEVNPYGPINLNFSKHWSPPMDVAHATYSIFFDRLYLVESIEIDWVTKPPKFEI